MSSGTNCSQRALTVRTLGPATRSWHLVFEGLVAVQGWHPDGVAGFTPGACRTYPSAAAPAATRALVAAGADVLSISLLSALTGGRLPQAHRRGPRGRSVRTLRSTGASRAWHARQGTARVPAQPVAHRRDVHRAAGSSASSLLDPGVHSPRSRRRRPRPWRREARVAVHARDPGPRAVVRGRLLDRRRARAGHNLELVLTTPIRRQNCCCGGRRWPPCLPRRSGSPTAFSPCSWRVSNCSLARSALASALIRPLSDVARPGGVHTALAGVVDLGRHG